MLRTITRKLVRPIRNIVTIDWPPRERMCGHT